MLSLSGIPVFTINTRADTGNFQIMIQAYRQALGLKARRDQVIKHSLALAHHYLTSTESHDAHIDFVTPVSFFVATIVFNLISYRFAWAQCRAGQELIKSMEQAVKDETNKYNSTNNSLVNYVYTVLYRTVPYCTVLYRTVAYRTGGRKKYHL